MTSNSTRLSASRDSGALAGGLGAGPHQQTSDDYYTPTWLFDQLGLTFDLDVACPVGGALWVPAHRYYTKIDDGLTSPWHGCVWMNPPYSKPQPWVTKWINHNNGFALLPTNGGKWLKELWESPAKGVFLGRLAFTRNGKQNKNSPLNIVLWAIGHNNIEALHKVGKPR